MFAEVMTVVWKEWRELMTGRGIRSGRLSLLIIVVTFGVALPLQFGEAMIRSSLTMLAWGWVPPFLVIQVVADSFAGERERHTLETLLASRLSDRAILFGKIAAAVGYGWGLTLVCLLAGLVTLNAAAGGIRLLIYPPHVVAGIFVFTFFSSSITATAGVLISLRATSARQVQQIMSIAWMISIFGIGYGARLVLPRNAVAALFRWFSWLEESFSAGGLVALAGIVLAAVNLLLIAIAQARFRRSRLLLDQ